MYMNLKNGKISFSEKKFDNAEEVTRDKLLFAYENGFKKLLTAKANEYDVKNKKIQYLFAGAKTIDDTLVNTKEADTKTSISKFLKQEYFTENENSFYKQLDEHPLCKIYTKVFVWTTIYMNK